MSKEFDEALNKLRLEPDVLKQKKMLKIITADYTEHYLGHYFLGTVYDSLFKYKKALLSYKICIELNPKYQDAYLNLMILYTKLGDEEEFINCSNKALENFKHPKLFNIIGYFFHEKGRHHEAINWFKQGLETENITDDIRKMILINMSSTYITMGDETSAVDCLQKANSVQCTMEESLNSKIMETFNINMGIMSLKDRSLTSSEEHYKNALTTCNIPILKLSILNNLSSINASYGNIVEAIAYYNQVLEISDKDVDKSKLIEVFQNKLYSMNFIYINPMLVYKEHTNINNYFNTSIPMATKQYSHKKINIGFVSPDFSSHPVMMFALRLLEKYDKKQFNVYCFSSTVTNDTVTDRIQASVDYWINISDISDNKLIADMIRQEEIDILIDLAGHTSKNRLEIFSYKPAPIQVSYIGYPNTTGLYQMDYRITDHYVDDVPNIEQEFKSPYYTEKFIFMPRCFLCYTPLQECVANDTINDPIIFGVFNKFNKISPECFSVWNKILRLCPKSKIMFKFRFQQDSKMTTKIIKNLNIEPSRIIFRDTAVTHIEHMNVYNEVDICLDTFPYSGTTTSCESIYMGRPCITYHKKGIHAHNVTGSILHYSGFDELVAHTEDEYVGIAIRLVNNIEILQKYRTSLRPNLMKTMNSEEYVKDFYLLMKHLVHSRKTNL